MAVMEAAGITAALEAEMKAVDADIAEMCGVMNAATGRLVELIAKVAGSGGWRGCGIRSLEHWVTWKCGVSSARARGLTALAGRLGELPATRAALVAGELTEDRAKVVCAHVPDHHAAEAADRGPAGRR